MFFVPKMLRLSASMSGADSETNPLKEEVNIKLGRCRRHAPTMSGWPVMFVTDWCGDHKLDERRIPLAQLI
jgi:hypothetical protein